MVIIAGYEGCIDVAITADPFDPRRVNNLVVWASAGIEPTDKQMRGFNAEDGGPLF
jgi:hypothetical protein